LLPQVLRHGGRALELGAGLFESAELLEQVRSRAGQQVVASKRMLFGQRIEDRQPGRWSFGHRNGHGAIELHDGGRRDGIQLAVQRRDPRPVRLDR
jgi:hypothetical protein